MSELTGQTVAGYPIERLLHKAAYREVYQAQTSGAPLALKVLREDLRADKHFASSVIKGWEGARAVVHPNLVTIFGTGTDAALGPYSLDELISGKVLRPMIMEGAKIAWRDCLIIAEQLFGAIHALHQAKQYHGEIWPANILMTQDQDLKLEGAGGLTHLDVPLTELFSGPALGYQAPERIDRSPLSTESDIYSAGACLYFVLAGQDPFPGEDPEVVAKAVQERKPAPVSVLREDLPPEAEQFIARLMAKDPTQRYGSVADVLTDIANLKNGKPMAPLKGGKAPAPPRLKPRPMPRPADSNPPDSKHEPAAALPPVSARRTGLLAAVKGGPPPSGERLVFGRLETHVKSTIPQSETEKRGDDFYKQGQLPLALNTWKDAFSNATPHAALKVKIELAEKELKKEAYAVAIEEARHRMLIGDHKGAIERAREALLAAEGDQQRQEALRVETEASEASLASAKQGKIKLAAGIAAFLVVAFLISKLFGGSAPEEDDDDPTKKGADKFVVKKIDMSSLPAGVFPILNGAATVKHPSNWVVDRSELHVKVPDKEPAVVMRSSRIADGTPLEQKRQELLDPKKKPEAEVIDNVEVFMMIENYQVAEVGLKYMDGETPSIRYVYLISGPSDSLFTTEFRGTEADFTFELRQQMKAIMQSWTFVLK
jgi:serine/threonine protein kinase